MTLGELFIIAVAVSLDAFGVALCIGLNGEVKFRKKTIFSISFGFFQFLFSLIGGIGGKIFIERVVAVPSIIGGMVIAIVGVLMIKEGMECKNDNLILNPKMYCILGISVSIDAIVVGFVTLSALRSMVILITYTVIIGIVTLIMSIVAFIISKYLVRIEVIGKYADYIGGIILILFGLKMIFF